MVAQAMPVTSAVTLCYPAPVLGPETTWDMVTSAPWFQVVMKWILYHYGSLLAAKLFLSRYNILGPVVKTRPCLGSGVSGLCPLPINVVWYSSLFAFVKAQNRSTVHIINLRVMRETKQLFHFVEQLDARWVESIIYLVNQKKSFFGLRWILWHWFSLDENISSILFLWLYNIWRHRFSLDDLSMVLFCLAVYLKYFLKKEKVSHF